MSFARLRPLFAASSFRLSAIYGAILVATFVLAGIGAVLASRSAAQTEIQQRIQLEMDALQQEMRTEGMNAAIAAIRTRSESPGSLEYQLITPNGQPVILDLGISHPRIGWSRARIRENEAGPQHAESFLVLTQPTPDGGLLTIGDDLERAENVRVAILRTLVWIGVAALALALLAGWLATQAAMKRMAALSATLTRVGAGDLSVRAPEGVDTDDIAELGRAINRMLSQIQLLISNIRRVSTDIAHDLRTPLTHVRQHLETAAQTSDVATAHEAIQVAQGKIDDVLRVFAAMLRLAEIDSGAARDRFAAVDLAALVARVADAYRPDIEASGRTLIVGPIEPATIAADADLIAQALANLIENAMHHTPEGSPITLRLAVNGALTRLEIEDRGPGVPAQERERVLSAFTRLDASRSSPGSGLGLSIVAAIARLHGARMVLEDAEPGLRIVLEWGGAQH
jgi:signal transduction histidine kinase